MMRPTATPRAGAPLPDGSRGAIGALTGRLPGGTDVAKTRNRHNAAFVVGSVLGGVAGAAIALWKTPYSGEELRERITGGTDTTVTGTTATGVGTGSTEPRFSSKLLSSVENTLAPVVGVRLGKTANEGTVAPVTTPVVPAASTRGTGTTEPPAFVDTADVAPTDTATGTGIAEPGTASAELAPEGIGHAASTDELTTPQVEVTPEAFKEAQGEMKPFPKLGSDRPPR
jgi:hypothetical protein